MQALIFFSNFYRPKTFCFPNEGIISNYDRNGFTISGGFGSGGLSFSNGTYSCNVVREETGETDEDNLPIYIYVFSC